MKYKYFVYKARIKNGRSEAVNIAGYKTKGIAERLAKRAAQTWKYVEWGRYNPEEQFPEYHVMGRFIENEEQGGDLLWDSLTQANQQALEEVNPKAGDLQPEVKQVQ